MTVEQARGWYRGVARDIAWTAGQHRRGLANLQPAQACRVCGELSLEADAASLALDLAVAAACQEREIRAVAW